MERAVALEVDQSSAGKRRVRAWLKALTPEIAVILAFVLLTVVATYPLVLNFTTAIPGNGLDGWLFYWNIWWVKRSLLELYTNPFFTTEVFYPQGTNLYYHTLVFVPDVLALPVVLVFGLTTGYNFIVLLGFVGSGYGTYRLMLYLLSREGLGPLDLRLRMAALVAGTIFTFSAFHLVRLLGHLNLVSLEWVPFYILFLFKTWDQAGWRNPLVAGLFLAMASLTDWQYGLFLVIFSVIFLICRLLRPGQGVLRWRSLASFGLLAGLALLMVAPVLVPMLLLDSSAGRTNHAAAETLRFSADLLAFIIPSPQHPLWGQGLVSLYRQLAGNDFGVETVVFLGYIPLVLVSLAAPFIWKRQRFWLVAFTVFSVLALGPVLHIAGKTSTVFGQPIPLPYAILSALPYGDILRTPNRFVLMSMLCLAVSGGYGSFVLLRRLRGPAKVGLVAGFLLVVMLFETAAVPYKMSPVDIPPLYDRLAQDGRPMAIVEVPIPNDPGVYPRRMLYQTRHGKPSYGGYIARGRPPLDFSTVPGFAEFTSLSLPGEDIVPYNQPEQKAIALAVLNQYKAGYVVLDKDLLTAKDLERARTVAKALLGNEAPWYEDNRTVAFVVPPSPPVPSCIIYPDEGWYRLEKASSNPAPGQAPCWRWMGKTAKLGLVAFQPGTWHLKLNAWSLGGPRRLEVLLDGRVLGMLEIEPEAASYTTPSFAVSSGSHLLTLRSLDGVGIPSPADKREISVGVSEISLEP